MVAGEEKGAKTAAVEVVLPPSDWSIGLDRGADETVKRKDPEIAIATKPAIIEASLTKEVKSEPAKTTAAVEIEVPSVIDMPLLTVIDSTGAATKAQKEESLSKQLTIDSPGAIIKIDRQPDHAVIPIVVATTTTITTKAAVSPKAEDEKAQTSTAVEVSKSDSKKKAKKEKEVKHKKTSPIDLPLIDILVPKPKTQTSEDEKKSSKKDKKQKKEKKDKSKSTKEVCSLLFI